jgi:hypothetical protein
MVDDKLKKESAKFIEKKIRLALEVERLQKNYVRSVAKFLGLPVSKVEKSLAVQHYYEAIRKGKPEIAKKIVAKLLEKWREIE